MLTHILGLILFPWMLGALINGIWMFICELHAKNSFTLNWINTGITYVLGHVVLFFISPETYVRSWQTVGYLAAVVAGLAGLCAALHLIYKRLP